MGLDGTSVTTKEELLKALRAGQVKQHLVYDAVGRIQFAFDAPIATADGEPCLVTEYVYRDAASTQIRDRQERVYSWKVVWEGNFVFDATTSYDPDGDGVI